MSYYLEIHGVTSLGTPVTTLSRLNIQRWSHRINAPGTLVFSINAFDPHATDENLRVKRRVRLVREKRDGSGTFLKTWLGYIDDKKQVDNQIEVVAQGLLQALSKRETANNELFNGAGSTEIFDLLAAINGIAPTGITAGTGGVTTVRSVQMQGTVDVLSAIGKRAAADGAEYEVDTDARLNYVPSLGSDKSGSIHLTYYLNGQPGTNLAAVQIGESGREMANRVYGVSSVSGGLTSMKEDPASQALYGLLIERKQFNEAQDQTTLDAMTQAFLSQRSTPPSDFQIDPRLASLRYNVTSGSRTISGLQYDDVSLGDLVTVTIVTQNRSETSVKRIVGIDVAVDENLNERLSLTLSKAGVFVTASYLDATQVDRLRTELKQVELLL